MRTAAFVSSLVAFAIAGAGACTNDFDQFRGNGGDSSTQGGSSSGAGSSSGGSSSGGSSSGGSSGGSSSGSTSGDVDAAPACADISGSCFTQEQACNNKCTDTHTTCTDPCAKGNPGKACRDQCDAQQQTCLADCNTVCAQCAGPQCAGDCP